MHAHRPPGAHQNTIENIPIVYVALVFGFLGLTLTSTEQSNPVGLS